MMWTHKPLGQWRYHYLRLCPLFQRSATGLTQMRSSLRIDSEWAHRYYDLAYQLLLYLVIVPKFAVPLDSSNFDLCLNRHPLHFNSSTSPRRVDRACIHLQWDEGKGRPGTNVTAGETASLWTMDGYYQNPKKNRDLVTPVTGSSCRFVGGINRTTEDPIRNRSRLWYRGGIRRVHDSSDSSVGFAGGEVETRAAGGVKRVFSTSMNRVISWDQRREGVVPKRLWMPGRVQRSSVKPQL